MYRSQTLIMLYGKLNIPNRRRTLFNQYDDATYLSITKMGPISSRTEYRSRYDHIYDERTSHEETYDEIDFDIDTDTELSPDCAFLNLHGFHLHKIDVMIEFNNLLILDETATLIGIKTSEFIPTRPRFHVFCMVINEMRKALQNNMLTEFKSRYIKRQLTELELTQTAKFIELLKEIPDPNHPNFVDCFLNNTEIGIKFLRSINVVDYIRISCSGSIYPIYREHFQTVNPFETTIRTIIDNFSRNVEYELPEEIYKKIEQFEGNWAIVPIQKCLCVRCNIVAFWKRWIFL